MVGGSIELSRRGAGAPDVPPGPFHSSEYSMTPTTARRSSRTKKAEKSVPARPFVAHLLAPVHEVLSEDASRQVFEQIGASPERLPKILVTDPGLQADPKFIAQRDAGELLVGRLVRIRRPSQTAGTAIAYRVIVASAGGA
ncbi:DNA-directed RNA polymerase subunit H [mine drainage metagenome]|uniref:DNA-directed RNA polymerase subunit H n=1 Tax=mine drainage metagenome TaxID=410659 RepID=T1C8E5_9ZZZZ